MKRLKYNKKGWYSFGYSILTGVVDHRTGLVNKDQYGASQRDIWIGPFKTYIEAFNYALPVFR